MSRDGVGATQARACVPRVGIRIMMFVRPVHRIVLYASPTIIQLWGWLWLALISLVLKFTRHVCDSVEYCGG